MTAQPNIVVHWSSPTKSNILGKLGQANVVANVPRLKSMISANQVVPLRLVR